MRSSFLDKIGTFFVVSLITVVIWLYAEGENLGEYTLPVMVKFVGPGGTEVAITPRNAESIDVTFRASKSQLNDFNAAIDQGPILLEAPPLSGNDLVQRTIDLDTALDQSALGTIGISIQNTDPPRIDVTAQPVLLEEMPILVEYGDSDDVRFAKPPTTDPVAVSIALPAELARSATGRSVIARLDPADLRRLEIGVPQTLNVPLELPDDLESPWQRITPDRVDVSFTIVKQTDTTPVERVPINLSVPPLMLQRYSIELPIDQMTLPKVVVEGPRDEIERIKSQPTLIRAEIRLTGDDLARGATTATVVIGTPPGVTVVSPPPPITVPVTVTPLNPLNGAATP